MVPIILSIILALLALATGSYILFSPALFLSNSELVQAEIGIFATFGALVSAIFVIYSYIQTNAAFIESQRPQLFIWISNEKGRENDNSEEIFPLTFINYKNITNNQFSDLTITVQVEVPGQIFSLNGLFQPNMIMIGNDQRSRLFKPLSELKEKGCDINETAAKGDEVLLKLSYSYTYIGQLFVVPCQEYRWNPNLQLWELR